jgi:predicted membrane-bound mannosyltransferase
MTDHHWERRSKTLLAALILAAFALRMYRLAQQPLSWDEGWSIGLSTLSWAEIKRITALDVHPPLYYVVFKLWLSLGRHEGWMRFLSVFAGVVTPRESGLARQALANVRSGSVFWPLL